MIKMVMEVEGEAAVGVVVGREEVEEGDQGR